MTSYLDGVLGLAERQRVTSHLSSCVNCAIYLDQMRQTAVWLADLPREEVTAIVKRELLMRFRTWCATDQT